jgi:hypothetical protein
MMGEIGTGAAHGRTNFLGKTKLAALFWVFIDPDQLRESIVPLQRFGS